MHHDYEGSRAELMRMLVEQGEEPAFIRRARNVQDAWQRLLVRCQSQREELLKGPQMHFAALASCVHNDWSQLAGFLVDQRQVDFFPALYHRWKQRLRLNSHRTGWGWSCRRALIAFTESADRFDRAWRKFLQQLDLGAINALRRDFNEYYPVERACAFDCEAADLLGFDELEPVTLDLLWETLPPLRAPQLQAK